MSSDGISSKNDPPPLTDPDDEGFESQNPTPRDYPIDESMLTSTPKPRSQAASRRPTLESHFSTIEEIRSQRDENVEPLDEEILPQSESSLVLDSIRDVIKMSKSKLELQRNKKRLSRGMNELSEQLNESRLNESRLMENESRIVQLEEDIKRHQSATEEKDAQISNLQTKLSDVNKKMEPSKVFVVPGGMTARRLKMKRDNSTQEDELLKEFQRAQDSIRNLECEREQNLKLLLEARAERDTLNAEQDSVDSARRRADETNEILRNENNELQRKVEEYVHNLRILQDERDLMRMRSDDCRKNAKELETQTQENDRHISGLKKIIDKHQLDNDALKSKLHDYDAKKTEMKNELAAIQKERENWETEKAAIEAERKHIKKINDENQAHLSDLRSKETTITTISQELREAKDKIQKMEKERTKKDGEFQELEKRFENLMTSSMNDREKTEEALTLKDKSEREFRKLQESLKTREKEYDELKEKIRIAKEAASENYSYADKIARLEEHNKKLISEVDFLNTKIESAPPINLVKELEKKHIDSEAELRREKELREKLEDEERRSKKEVLELTKRVAELKGTLAAKDKEREKLDVDLERLAQDQLASNEHQNILKAELQKKEEDFTNYKNNALAQYSHEIKDKDMQIMHLRERLANLEDYPGKETSFEISEPSPAQTPGVVTPCPLEMTTLGDLIPLILKQRIDELKKKSVELAQVFFDLERTRIDAGIGTSPNHSSTESHNKIDKRLNQGLRELEAMTGAVSFSGNSQDSVDGNCNIFLLNVMDTLKSAQCQEPLSPNIRDLIVTMLKTVEEEPNSVENVQNAVKSFFANFAFLVKRLISQMESRESELSNQLMSASEEIGRLTHNLREADKEIGEMKLDWDQRNVEEQNEYDRLRARIRSLEEEKHEVSEHLEQLTDEKCSLQESNKYLKNVLNERDEGIKELMKEVEEDQREIEKLSDESSDRLAKLVDARAEKEQLERRLIERDTELHSLHLREEEYTRERRKFHENSINMRNEHSKVKEDRSRLDGKCRELEIRNNDLVKEIDVIEKHKVKNQQSVVMLDTAFHKSVSHINNMIERYVKMQKAMKSATECVYQVARGLDKEKKPKETLQRLSETLREQTKLLDREHEQEREQREKLVEEARESVAQVLRSVNNVPARTIRQKKW